MTKEAYIRAVMRNLRLPRKIKKRIKNDLLSDFTARMETGETQEQIIKDMGTPDKVAAEFHENFAGQLLPQRTPLDWFLLIAGILFGAIALLKVLGEVFQPFYRHFLQADQHSQRMSLSSEGRMGRPRFLSQGVWP